MLVLGHTAHGHMGPSVYRVLGVWDNPLAQTPMKSRDNPTRDAPWAKTLIVGQGATPTAQSRDRC
jgi:hypothetical protein